MTELGRTLTLVGLAAATLAAAIFGPGHGSPEPVVMLAIMVAALTAGIAGLAFSAICGAILLHLLEDPIRVLLLMSVCSLANQFLTVWTLRHDIVWRSLAGLVAGGMAGIGPGVWALIHLEHRVVADGIGAVLFAYAGSLLLGRLPRVSAGPRWTGAAIGFTAGVTGAIAALPSLPVTFWCQLRGLSKDALRATVQPFVLAMQVVTLPLVIGAAPAGVIGPADLLCIPAGLLGTQIGLGCASGLSNRQFSIAIACLLSACGASFWL